MAEPPSPTRPAGAGIEVVVDNDQPDHPINASHWARLAEHALATSSVLRGELTVSFVDEATIAELNEQHMGADGPTDVLAFPLDTETDDDPPAAAGAAGSVPDMPVLLGDVVICPAVAARNAPDHATNPHPGHPDHDGSLDDELALLVVHGVLHVVGMDHADPAEAAEMHEAERTILGTFDRDESSGS